MKYDLVQTEVFREQGIQNINIRGASGGGNTEGWKKKKAESGRAHPVANPANASRTFVIYISSMYLPSTSGVNSVR